MKNIDFLGVSPSIYLLSESSGKTKLGGFFSIIYVLSMLALIIYYLFTYFAGKDYKVQYLGDNSLGFLSEDKEDIKTKDSIELIFVIEKLNYENGKIHLNLYKANEGKFYNETNLKKCDLGFENEKNFTAYCFNLSFGDNFYLECEGNCTDSLTGNPYIFNYALFYKILKINHNKKNPFTFINSPYTRSSLPISIKKNEGLEATFHFTSVLYKTTNVFKNDLQIYNENFVSNIIYLNYYDCGDTFFSFHVEPSIQNVIYERQYKTLLETFSEIGGMYANLRIVFTFLTLFYSSYENNYQIVKNLMIKKNLYQNNEKKNINSKKFNNKSIEFNNIEKAFDKKKVKINSWEHYFCSIFNGHKQKKTMKILNLCKDLVSEHLSAENIIFNSILFERFYEDNPINVKDMPSLKELENEMFENNKEMEFLLGIT